MQTVAENRALQQSSIHKKSLLGKPPVILDIPGIDMYAEDGGLVTEVLLPEFTEDEVKITATGDGLEIDAAHSGEPIEPEEGRQSYWRHLSLPKEAKPQAMKQEFHNGKLRITMPVGEPLDVFEKELMRRKEKGNDLREVTPKGKRAKTFGFRDQEFPNHWTRYRPVR